MVCDRLLYVVERGKRIKRDRLEQLKWVSSMTRREFHRQRKENSRCSFNPTTHLVHNI